MIKADQPTIFGNAVNASVSSLTDGNMKFDVGDAETVAKNRSEFLTKTGINPLDTTLVALTYDTDDFTKYRIVTHDDKAVGVLNRHNIEHADALVSTTPHHALLLPLADCVGAILYDPKHRILMVSHLGRHSVEMDGAKKSVMYLKDQFASQPADIQVWLSPAVGKDTYPLNKFDGKSLHEVILSQLYDAGVSGGNIEVSSVNTATSEHYFSHSEYLKNPSAPNGRFAIVAEMREQGEPAS
ncbi:MAG TPA: laccase domain-containing protein [Candidatus Saccharimonadales bacterium]|nr:laccase domain-containing protein [Candidatus Saccharimonadales bacterium]